MSRRPQVPRGRSSKPKQPQAPPKQATLAEVETYTPIEYPDTIKSNATAFVLDALCEGEIEGLVDSAGNLLINQADFGKGIFLDDTPVMGASGKPNFNNIKFGMTWGTQDQTALANFGQPASVVYSGDEVKAGTDHAVTLGITNPDAWQIEVAVRVPQLIQQNKISGDTYGTKVEYRVQIDLNGVGTFAAYDSGVLKIEGKASNAYVRTTTHILPRSSPDSTSDTWNVRVTRITPDATSLSVSNRTYFDYVQVLNRNLYRYPNTALIGAEVAAAGFSQIPARAYRVRGLKIQLPTNYDPTTRWYNRNADGSTETVVVVVENPDPSGDAELVAVTVENPTPGLEPASVTMMVENPGGATLNVDFPVEQPWDGDFYVAWSNNPAWCFYDLATNPRYGLGEHLGTDAIAGLGIDKWTLYSIGRYCDLLVDDGFGTYEPRFTCNLVLQGREEAWKVMQDMASIFRGMLYWQENSIVAVQDRPKLTAAHFSNANTVERDGVHFVYSGTAKKARHTVVVVRYNDPGDMFRPKYEYVEDPDGISKYGYRETIIGAFGCSSRGQAHRLGRWVLLSEQFETDSVGFLAGMDGATLRPGDIIEVLDENRSGKPNAGRVLSIAEDRESIVIDREIYLPAGTNTIALARPAAYITPSQVESSDDIVNLRVPQRVTYTLSNAALPTSTGALNLGASVTAGSTLVIAESGVSFTAVRVGDYFVAQGRTFIVASVTAPSGPDWWQLTLTTPFSGSTDTGSPFEVRTRSLTFAAPISADIAVGAVWLVETPTLEPQKFRVLNVKEDEPHIYAVEGIEYVEAKFDAVELGLELEEPDITDLEIPTSPVPQPRNVTVRRAVIITPEGAKLVLVISWDGSPDGGVAQYKVEFRRVPDNWATLEFTEATESNYFYTTPGDYEFRVTAISHANQYSDYVLVAFTVEDGNPIELATIANLEIFGQGNDHTFTGRDVVFEWRLVHPAAEDPLRWENYTDPYFETFVVEIWTVGVGAYMAASYLTRETTFNFSYEKNVATINGPRPQFEIRVKALDKFGNASSPATLVATNAPPGAPTSIITLATWKFVTVQWTPPADRDLAEYRIYRHTSDVFLSATLVATVSSSATTYMEQTTAGATYYYWVLAVDTFGSLSTAPGGTSVLTGTVEITDVDLFPVDASALFVNVVILQGDSWTGNATDTISWNAHTIYVRGRPFSIAAGSTTHRYIYWLGPTWDEPVIAGESPLTPGDGFYSTSNTHPGGMMQADGTVTANLLGTRGFIIATNLAGVPNMAWRGFANAVIGSAFIERAAILNAHIANVAADKITAGDIAAQLIRIASIGTSVVTGYVIESVGSGQTNGVHTLSITGGGGSGATATATVSGGIVTAVSPGAAGSGYTSAPLVVLNAGGTPGVIRATISSGVDGALISTNHIPGTAGWAIHGDGSAEFNDLRARGTFKAGTIFTDVKYAHSEFPANELRPSGNVMMNWTTVNFLWNTGAGITNPTRLLIGGSFLDGVYTGTTVVKNFQLPDIGRGERFVGVSIADGIAGTKYDASSRTRIASYGGIGIQRTPFHFWLSGVRSGGGTGIALLYRLWPAAISAVPANNDASYPWVMSATRPVFSDTRPMHGTVYIGVPKDWVLEFNIAPVNSSGDSTGTTDVIDDISLSIITQNF